MDKGVGVVLLCLFLGLTIIFGERATKIVDSKVSNYNRENIHLVSGVVSQINSVVVNDFISLNSAVIDFDDGTSKTLHFKPETFTYKEGDSITVYADDVSIGLTEDDVIFSSVEAYKYYIPSFVCGAMAVGTMNELLKQSFSGDEKEVVEAEETETEETEIEEDKKFSLGKLLFGTLFDENKVQPDTP